VPWRKIPENIYFTARVIWGVLNRPDFRGTREYIKAHGIDTSISIPRRNDIPWLSQNMPGASIPLEVVPPNVTATGPIVFDPEPAAEQDPELVAWLARAPTVLINLGSIFIYSEHHATTMALAIEDLLAKTDVQVLWKMGKEDTIPDNYTVPAQNAIDQGRLRVTNWLTVSPASILATGHIVASVHHGGANCYHEAIAYGVP
jgi:UDP:flavonoid glycosyltransferase YjiC (YdhE family)